MKKVIVYKDNDNEIIVSKDYHHGVVVQVIRYIDALQQTNEGTLTNIVKPQVMFSKQIGISQMREEISKVIAEAQAVINDLKEKDQKIYGLLNDLFSAHRDLNEPAEQ